MDFKEASKSIEFFSIKDARRLNKMLGKRMHKLTHILINALPEELRKTYGYWDAVSNLVWSGGCTFCLIKDVGLNIDEKAKQRLINEGQKRLKPVVDAWLPFGVRQGKVSFLPANNGIIEAHFWVPQ